MIDTPSFKAVFLNIVAVMVVVVIGLSPAKRLSKHDLPNQLLLLHEILKPEIHLFMYYGSLESHEAMYYLRPFYSPCINFLSF